MILLVASYEVSLCHRKRGRRGGRVEGSLDSFKLKQVERFLVTPFLGMTTQQAARNYCYAVSLGRIKSCLNLPILLKLMPNLTGSNFFGVKK